MDLKNNVGYILDDHILFAEALSKLLETYANFGKVYTYTDYKELSIDLSKVTNKENTFIFLDFYIGETLLLSVLQEILKSAKNQKIVVISGISNPLLLQDLIKHKIDGIVHKSDNTSEIVNCINQISLGNTYFTPTIKEILSSTNENVLRNPFSDREMELICLFAQGLTVEETAEYLNLSPFTVATHRKRMFRKIDCNNIGALIAFARKIEII